MKPETGKRPRLAAMATVVMVFILAMVVFFVWLNAQVLFALRRDIQDVENRQREVFQESVEPSSPHEDD